MSDSGLALERTGLARQRTALAAAVLTVLLVRTMHDEVTQHVAIRVLFVGSLALLASSLMATVFVTAWEREATTASLALLAMGTASVATSLLASAIAEVRAGR